MRAILRKQFGGPDVLEIREMPEPEPKIGHAVTQVKAFGLNHAELHMRKGEWAEQEKRPKIVCIDELDKMARQFQKLLNFMESGHIKVDQMRKKCDFAITEILLIRVSVG
jgi:hypothetical protein